MRLFDDQSAKVLDPAGQTSHLTQEGRRKPRPRRRSSDEKSIAGLLLQRDGTREEWNRILRYIFLADTDEFPPGLYRSKYCGCMVEIRQGNTYTAHLCPEHEELDPNCFELPFEKLVIKKRVEEFRQWYYKLPMAGVEKDAWGAFRGLALLPWDFGFKKPQEWLSKTVTIEAKYGACGCSYTMRRYNVEGVPWHARTGHVYLLVKIGSCGNHGNSCQRPNLPIGNKASRQINQIIAQYRRV
ncbi:MAG: hypothetical protein M1352_00500 [Patescibacteria group bacterium]|nr:hypothetical protein [Patescibacteria group bacterium]